MRHLPLISLAIAGLLPLTTTSAFAGGREYVDTPSANKADGDVRYVFTGQEWLPNQTAENYGSAPLGAGLATSVKAILDPKGKVVFVDSTNTPTGDYFAPLFRPAAPFTADVNNIISYIAINDGLVDPSLVDPTITIFNTSGTYDPTRGLTATRFIWSSVCATSGCDSSRDGLDFQAVSVFLGGDAYVLQFNYGFNGKNNIAGSNVPSGVSAGFQLGAFSAGIAGPYAQSGPDFCFNNGAESAFTTIAGCLGTTATTTVPEPDNISLLFAGGIGFVLFGMSRRRLSARERVPASVR